MKKNPHKIVESGYRPFHKNSGQQNPVGAGLKTAPTMSKKMFLLFNHNNTPEQKKDAKQSLGVVDFISLPEKLKKIWGNVPPDFLSLNQYLEPVRGWLIEKSKPGDFVLVQGDFGATFLMVKFAMENEMIPVYSTTQRDAEEMPGDNGVIKTVHNIRHIMFRKYGE